MRVLVGRGTGHFRRDYEPDQIIRIWNKAFSTFHELMCAVEASWVMPGSPEKVLDACVELEDFDFDLDLGPSRPPPKQCPTIAEEDNCIKSSLVKNVTRIKSMRLPSSKKMVDQF